MENKVPQELDWVEVRFNCSLVKVFDALCTKVKDDVDARNKLRLEGDRYKFEAIKQGNTLNVYRQSNSNQGTVYFERNEEEITVKDGDDKRMFGITLTVSDDGRCKPKINGKECELWQVRRDALEKLFFEGMSAR